MGNKTPTLPDTQTMQTMLPGACSDDAYAPYKSNIKRLLRINDEQVAVNRYKWYNLPPELNGNLLERILYYRGQVMVFFAPEAMRWYALPYTFDGNLDVYGRYDGVKPLPFLGEDQLKTKGAALTAILNTMHRTPVYDIDDIDGLSSDEFLETRCVLLTDYSKQLAQRVIPRQELNDGIIDIESNLIPYMNTMLSNSTGLVGMRVNDQDEQAQVTLASQTANLAALNAQKWMAIRAQLELQDLTSPITGHAEDMLLAMQALDNFRLGTFGLDNGGLFNKRDYQNLAQTAMNRGASSIVMEDGLYQRQRLCDIINNYVYIPMGMPLDNLWDCQISECASGGDLNMDGMIGNEGYTDNRPSVEQTMSGGEEDGD